MSHGLKPGADWIHFFHDDSDSYVNHRYVIDIFHIPSGKSVQFKAWVDNFSDSYESNWNTEDVYGRMDPISTFQGTRRTISLTWDVVASSMEEAEQNMTKCELLFSMLYPSYGSKVDNASSLEQAPLFKIRFGNLIGTPAATPAADAESAGLLCTLSGFEYAPDFDAGFFTPSPGLMLPQLITLGAEIQVLHNFALGWDGKEFRTPLYPYGRNLSGQESKAITSQPTGGSGGTTSTLSDKNKKMMEKRLRKLQGSNF